MKIFAQNKKAFHDYQVLDTIEAGIVLMGDEVKSIKLGQASLGGSYATFKDGELYLLNVNIAAYAQAYMKGAEPTRSRKLLLHRREIARIIGDMSRKGVTLIPLKLYASKKGLIKAEIGLCKHKNATDKKHTLKEKDIKRETERALRGR